MHVKRIDLKGRSVEHTYSYGDGSLLSGMYNPVRLIDDEWVCVLVAVRELMPPATPQMASLSNPNGRLPMMDQWGFSAALEAEQRQKEWAEVTKARMALA